MKLGIMLSRSDEAGAFAGKVIVNKKQKKCGFWPCLGKKGAIIGRSDENDINMLNFDAISSDLRLILAIPRFTPLRHFLYLRFLSFGLVSPLDFLSNFKPRLNQKLVSALQQLYY